jgi:ABC-2 type transport system ATP-binding protein
MVGRLTHLSPADARRRADELLGRFDLEDAADRPLKTFSGGMRRRLDLAAALAAALVHKPPVLFLDEPTTGLDPGSRLDLWAIIAELVADGTTLLLTTQYLEEADRLADRIAVIDEGTVIAEGTATELKARLGATVVEVGVLDVATAERARRLLAPMGHLTDGEAATTVGLQLADGPRQVAEVVRALDAAGIEMEKLGVREPTLDDVFLELTGHAASTETEAEEPEARRSRRGAA